MTNQLVGNFLTTIPKSLVRKMAHQSDPINQQGSSPRKQVTFTCLQTGLQSHGVGFDESEL